eukprot:COSAG04_NODE_895_length_9591_cov_13.543510_5_plen_178_part_00
MDSSLIPHNGGDWRLPTAAEERFMIYTALVAANATGLFFFGWEQLVHPSTWVRDTLNPVVIELVRYLPAIARGAIESRGLLGTAQPAIDAQAFNGAAAGLAGPLILAVNSAPNRTTLELHLSALRTGGGRAPTLRALSRSSAGPEELETDRAPIACANAICHDAIGGYGVNAYVVQM